MGYTSGDVGCLCLLPFVHDFLNEWVTGPSATPLNRHTQQLKADHAIADRVRLYCS